MRNLSALTLLSLVTSASFVQADTVENDLFRMGRDFCSIALIRQVGDFDASPYREALAETGFPAPQFCGCVGEEFRTTGDDEMAAALKQEIAAADDYAMLASFLRAGMNSCKPDGGLGFDLGLSDEDLSFEITDDADSIAAVIADNDFSPDEGDIHSCNLALAGDMMLPGFDPEVELTRVTAAGQSVAEVCSCAASYIASLGEPFQKEVEEALNPPTIYGSALAGGINICISDSQ